MKMQSTGSREAGKKAWGRVLPSANGHQPVALGTTNPKHLPVFPFSCSILFALVLVCGGAWAQSASMPASAPASAPASSPASAPASQAELPPDPDAPTVSARLDRTEGRVGDVFVLTVTAVHLRTVAVNLPSALNLGPFQVLEKLPEVDADLGNGKLRRDFQLRVAAYEPGDLTLPGVELTYLNARGEARTTVAAPIDVKIHSVLANENDPQLKPNAGPVPVVQRDLMLVYVLLALLLVALGLGLGFALKAWLRRRALRAVPPPPPRPAHEVALEKLDRLRAEDRLARGELKEFYFILSEVVREYLGRRYGFEALDMTTSEILALLRALPGRPVAERTESDLEAWLRGCDLVKFAKYVPDAGEAVNALEEAYRLVEATRPRPEPGIQMPPGAPGAPPPAAPPGPPEAEA
jgi:hypothetical protein